MPPIELSLDMETAGTQPSAIILSLGAALFDADTGATVDTCHLGFDLDDQDVAGRTMTGSTFLWWLGQAEEVRQRQIAMAPRLPLAAGLLYFTRWAKPHKPARIWARGQDFDIAILNHALRQTGIEAAWPFHFARDQRTIAELLPKDLHPPRDGVHHDALDDALHQAAIITAARRHITRQSA